MFNPENDPNKVRLSNGKFAPIHMNGIALYVCTWIYFRFPSSFEGGTDGCTLYVHHKQDWIICTRRI